MNDSLILGSLSSGGKTKDDLIQQAHKAREARELDRRREDASIVIQAYVRAYLIRRQIKEESRLELDKLARDSLTLSKANIRITIRKILFISNPQRDRNILDSLIQLILTPSFQKCNNGLEEASKSQVEATETVSQLEPEENQLTTIQKDSDDTSQINTSEKMTLIEVIMEDLKRNEKFKQFWLSMLAKIINVCIEYLIDVNSKLLDSQHIDTYLHLIDILTSSRALTQFVESPEYDPHHDSEHSAIIKKISNDLFERSILNRIDFINQLTKLICEKLSSFRNDLKRSILCHYSEIISSLLEKSDDFNNKKIDSVVTQLLCCPGIIYNLEKHSNDALERLIQGPIFRIAVNLVIDETTLSSTSTICFLANLIHLASKEENSLRQWAQSFIILSTKLLKSCQKDMLLSRGPKKSMNVSFHPILGWVTKEQASNIDKNVIKLQLNHLWSARISKILLSNLIETSEKIMQNQSIHAKVSKTRPNPEFTSNNLSSTTIPSLLRRVVERATLKSNKSSNSAPRAQKIMESNRISSICRLYFTALRTLVTLRQEILTNLCLHDHLLSNLWIFIRSLGIEAFLDQIHCSEISDILKLFCECSSHIISVLDDSELYEKQRPFSVTDLNEISTFMNIFVYKLLSNGLVSLDSHEMDPVLRESHKLLTDLYRRDSRRKFTPPDHWLIKEIKLSSFLKDLDAQKPCAKAILTMLPHAIPHRERVMIFRRLVARDRSFNGAGQSTLVPIRRSRIVEDGYQQLVNLSSNELKGVIRVKFINDQGLDEAGIDQDGVFKEFLEDTIKKVLDPALNLFSSTSDQRLYPSPTSRLHENHLSLFNFVGKMIGKAVYEGIVVDVPFATFFLSRVLGQPQSPLYSPIDELPSLDQELYKNLTYIKHYEGDVSDLGLTFSIDQDFMGKIETHELEPGGRSIPVTRETRVRYIHSVANFRMKTQIEKQTESFVAGFKSIVNLEWLTIFSASEFQRLISGDNTPIDLQDLRRNTKYFGGFHNNHRVVCWLWDILEKDFSSDELKLFLKFVTSCSKPPLLGFANLEPPFTIRCVEVDDDQDVGDTFGSVLRGFLAIRRSDPVDRLPTSSTCFNLLKLPNYQRRSTLRDKLRYAISSNAGFELS